MEERELSSGSFQELYFVIVGNDEASVRRIYLQSFPIANNLREYTHAALSQTRTTMQRYNTSFSSSHVQHGTLYNGCEEKTYVSKLIKLTRS